MATATIHNPTTTAPADAVEIERRPRLLPWQRPARCEWRICGVTGTTTCTTDPKRAAKCPRC